MNALWHELLIALCLVVIIEGILPFLSPRRWRLLVTELIRMTGQSDRVIRSIGLILMLVGTALLYMIH